MASSFEEMMKVWRGEDLWRWVAKRLANATLFRRGRRRLHGEILDALSDCVRVIDVAAGDDRLDLKIVADAEVRWVLLNDLDLAALRRGAEAHPSVSRLCADTLRLPVRRRFDVALVKNVLHHMTDDKTVEALLATAARVARRVVVMEIEDLFFDHEALRRLLSRTYAGARLEFRRVPTLRGTYALCRVDWPSAGGPRDDGLPRDAGWHAPAPRAPRGAGSEAPVDLQAYSPDFLIGTDDGAFARRPHAGEIAEVRQAAQDQGFSSSR